MRTRIIVDDLVLEGLQIPASAGPAVGRAFRGELARLLRDEPLCAGVGSSIPVTGSIPLPVPASPSILGTRVADAVYQGMVR